MASATPHEPNSVPTNQGFRLGIDFGTSHTTAILRWADGHTRPILFDGSPLLPSAVYADSDGQLLVGRDAIHAARLDPARFEPTPKRHVGTANDEDVTAMLAAVLGRVRDEAERVSGASIADIGVTLTYPAGWGDDRINILRDAGVKARLPEPRLVEEPVAAAGYYAAVLGQSIAAGSALVVYDFGGGTFDATVVAPHDDGYQVLALAGLDDVGGVDLDAALLRHVADKHRSGDPQAWQRLEDPKTPADRRHRRHLIEDVRAAKEMLSRAASAMVPIPLLEREARITREEFDVLARPFLDRTVATTGEVITAAATPVAAVLLVGGSSRIPLVRELLEQATGVQPSTIDQPETVVAEGSLRLADGASGHTSIGAALPTLPGATPPSEAAPHEQTRSAPTPSGQANDASTHDDQAHDDQAHEGQAHEDQAHEDQAHEDEAHEGQAHEGPAHEGPAANKQSADEQATDEHAPNAAATAPLAGRSPMPVTPALVPAVDPWDTGERVTTPVPLLPPLLLAPPTPLPSVPQQAMPTRPVHQPHAPRQPLPPARYVPPTRAGHAAAPVRPPQSSATAYRQYVPRGRRRWPVVLTVLGVLAILAAGAVVAYPYLSHPDDNAGGHTLPSDTKVNTTPPGATTPADTSTRETTGTTPSAPSPAAPYVRANPPTWLPAGWKTLADDGKQPTVVPGVATNSGSCVYTSTGVLHVTRDSFNVSGCNMAPEVKANVVRDVAVEAEFNVVAGCGGMWVRTGARGYFVDVCSDGTVELHLLGDDPPSRASRIGGPWAAANPGKTVVALLAQQAGLMVIIDGQPQTIIIDEAIGVGRIGVGGFAPASTVDTTISRFRAWTPTGSGG